MNDTETLEKMRELYPNCPPSRMKAGPGPVTNAGKAIKAVKMFRDSGDDLPVLGLPTMGFANQTEVKYDSEGLPVLECPKMNFGKPKPVRDADGGEQVLPTPKMF